MILPKQSRENREKVKAERAANGPPSDAALENAILAAGIGPKAGEVWKAKLLPGMKPAPEHADRLTVVGCGVSLATGEPHAVLDATDIPADALPPGTNRPLMLIPMVRFLALYERA